MIWDAVLAAVILGLLGAGHCLGMCGGIAAALSMAIGDRTKLRRISLLLGYNIGRICSYTLIGALAGSMVDIVVDQNLWILRVFAGFILIFMGLYIADVWKVLTLLERAGGIAWRHVYPLTKRLTPLTNYRSALVLGLLWGWLPCGLIYTALTYSALQGNWYFSAVTMLAFGIGTLPAVMFGGVAAVEVGRVVQRAFRARLVKYGMALAYISFGLWTIWMARAHTHLHMS